MFGWSDAKPAITTFAFDSKPFLSKDSDAMATTKSLSPLIQEMRVIKSEAEIKIMRQAGEISGKAFIEVTYERLALHKGIVWQNKENLRLHDNLLARELYCIFILIDNEVH